MHVRLIAVGDRQPRWVDAAFDEYAGRLPRHWKFGLKAIPTAARKGGAAGGATAREGEKVLAGITTDEFVVLLDERGKQPDSRGFADVLSGWQATGRDLAFVIGGPDGFSPACEARADYRLSLSSLTMPHGLARIVFIEQLYRAWTLQSGHPYHRD